MPCRRNAKIFRRQGRTRNIHKGAEVSKVINVLVQVVDVVVDVSDVWVELLEPLLVHSDNLFDGEWDGLEVGKVASSL